MFTCKSHRGCARLSVTIAIDSDDSELVADPRPQALQRHGDRPAVGREESDEGIPNSLICRNPCFIITDRWIVLLDVSKNEKFKMLTVLW